MSYKFSHVLVSLTLILLSDHVVFLDGLLRHDVGHGLVMLVSPLVLFFHPLHSLCVGFVEGVQTHWWGLANAESLDGTKTRKHTVHQLRKTEVLVSALLSDTIFLPSHLPSLTRHGICFQDDGLRTNGPFLSSPKKL